MKCDLLCSMAHTHGCGPGRSRNNKIVANGQSQRRIPDALKMVTVRSLAAALSWVPWPWSTLNALPTPHWSDRRASLIAIHSLMKHRVRRSGSQPTWLDVCGRAAHHRVHPSVATRAERRRVHWPVLSQHRSSPPWVILQRLSPLVAMLRVDRQLLNSR